MTRLARARLSESDRKLLRRMERSLDKVAKRFGAERAANQRMVARCNCPGFCFFHTPLGMPATKRAGLPLMRRVKP